METYELGPVTISATVIVISRDMKALILQRLPTEKNFPNLWTVAGGKLKATDGDFICDGFYYNTAEEAACRELYEETGLLRGYTRPRLKYLCSITSLEATRRLILSYYLIIDVDANELHIETENGQNYKWITESEIKNYEFIIDIGGEIKKVFKIIEDQRKAEIERIMKS